MSANRFDFLASICQNCNYLDCECDNKNNFTNTPYTSTTINKSRETIRENTSKNDFPGTDYDLSTMISNSTHSDNIYGNTTTENYTALDYDTIIDDNDVHENNLHENVHAFQSSMSAQSMLNLGLHKKGFKMGHLNVQGIQNKIDQIDLLLNSSQNNIQVLGLSESKLNSFHMNHIFEVKNYQMFRKDRTISEERPEQGGGLLVYVKEGINCKRRCDLECERIECVWLEIFLTNSKSFLVGNIYRHPNETISWNEQFENYLEKVLECEKEVYLLGDFNRDLMQDNIKQSWLEYMETFGLFQFIKVPTRVTDLSATLIDHVYSNTHTNILMTTVPQVGLSDHFPIFISRKQMDHTVSRIPTMQYHTDPSKTLMKISSLMICSQPHGTS